MKKRPTFLVFGSPQITDEDIESVVTTMRSGWLGTGPKTHNFEQEFAKYLGVKHCIALSSCTAGLHVAFITAEIKPGDEVLVPSMTFCASANAVIHAGATPVFVDVDPYSMTMDPEDVVRKITPKTRALLPVHFHGRPANMDVLQQIAQKHNLLIIDDAAHAIETEYHGKKMGQLSDLTCFSFYITKNMTTVEGGMVATANDAWAKKIKIYALHGMSQDAWARFSDKGYKHYQVVVPGFKYNMTDMQASLGLSQLKRIEENLLRRKTIWTRYIQAFQDLPLILPAPEEPNTRHACHLFAIRVTEKTSCSRDELMQKLFDLNIGTGVHYMPVHLHEYYKNTFGYAAGDLPVSEKIGLSTLSLPLSAAMNDQDVQDVIDAVRECVV